MVELTARSLYPWAILPEKVRVDRTESRDRQISYAHFRWLRALRQREDCAPWRLGQEIGWYVRSPIDVQLTPLDDLQFEASPDELDQISAFSGRPEFWQRNGFYIATRRSDWLRLFQFEGAAGWENMFVPNGGGSVEWRLGWAVNVPSAYFILILPAEGCDGLDVPIGVLAPSALSRMAQTGFSIAVQPVEAVKIRRGQAVARIVLVSGEALRATLVLETNAVGTP